MGQTETEKQVITRQIDRCLSQTSDLIKQLDSAKKWSWVDLFMDSGLMSWLKRDKMKTINHSLDQLEADLENLNLILSQANFVATNQFSNRKRDFVFDVLFDNIFTDMSVHNEIGQIRQQIEDLETQLHALKQSF